MTSSMLKKRKKAISMHCLIDMYVIDFRIIIIRVNCDVCLEVVLTQFGGSLS